MPIEVSLRKLLHRKSWEYLNALPTANTSGACVVSDKFNILKNNPIYLMAGYSSIFRYDGTEDGFTQLPNSGLAGTFGLGACMDLRYLGAMGGVFNQTSTGGSATTIQTNKTIVKSLSGCRLMVISGTGVGYDNFVTSNTIGANSVITVPQVGSFTFDATTVFRIFSGSLWVQGSSTSAGFSVYDIATNTWTAKTPVGVTWGTDAKLVSTPGAVETFSTNDATGGTSNTISDSTKTWVARMWKNYQVRIYEGTGIGQIRTISDNTTTTITVSSNWTVTPDATSKFKIEGNDDYFYLIGNSAPTTYRFSVSAGTWTNVSPTVARSGNPTAGMSGNWIDSVSGWEIPSTGTVPLLTTGIYRQNGRYIFSFRGGASSTLDVYDIAANTWINDVSYGSKMETFSTGSSSFDYNGNIYIQKEVTGRIYKFNISEWNMESFNTCPAVQGSATVGDKMCMLTLKDGSTELNWLYTCINSQLTFMRVLVI